MFLYRMKRFKALVAEASEIQEDVQQTFNRTTTKVAKYKVNHCHLVLNKGFYFSISDENERKRPVASTDPRP